MKNAKKLNVDIFIFGVNIRKIGKHADLLVDVEGWQHEPTVSACPMAGVAFGNLVNVPTPN